MKSYWQRVDGIQSSSTFRRPPTADELADLFVAAADRREPLEADGNTDAFRLFHQAADGLDGIAVDRFADVLVLHLSDPEVEPELVIEALDLAFPWARACYVKHHPRQASRLSEEERSNLAPSEPAWGAIVEAVLASEEGANYIIRPGEGLSVGLFLDMREVRSWLRSEASGQSVLNLFAYTCAFGVVASLGGASRVLNLDLSKAYLAWGKENYVANGLTVDDRDFVFGDAEDWLRRMARRDERFDIVVLDPPSFSTARRGARFSVASDYGRVAALAATVVAPGGVLLAALNHAGTRESTFRGILAESVASAGRRARLIRRWHEPSIDFPSPPGVEPYLKVVALRLDG